MAERTGEGGQQADAMRKGAKATPERVRQAVDQLRRDGKAVTIRAIQGVTGGSFQSIYRALEILGDDMARSEMESQGDGVDAELDAKARALVGELYGMCKARANEIATLALGRKGERARELMELEGSIERVEAEYLAKAEACASEVARVQAEKATLESELQAERSENGRLAERVSRLELELEIARGNKRP